MKILSIILFCLTTLTIVVSAQNKPGDEALSNVEKFSTKTGTLIQKQVVTLGKIRTTSFQVMTLTDLLTNTKISGIRLETESISGYVAAKIAFLDKDEVDALLKSINAIKTKVINTTPTDYTEVVFTSRGGFSFGAFYRDSKWMIFLKFDRFRSDSSVYFPANELDGIDNLLQQAKQKLDLL